MPVSSPIIGLSSKASAEVVAELVALWQSRGGAPVVIESVGGVEAARRVASGNEHVDVVFLASAAIDPLLAQGRVLAGSKVDLMRSPTVAAVRAGAPHPEIDSEQAVRAAVLRASRVGISTGPSGRALRALFARWGIAPPIVEAPVGVPVGQLLAQGEVSLGFQQLSEFIHQPGIEIVGHLPASIALETVFSAAVVSDSAHLDEVRELLTFMASPGADIAKQRQGMQPLQQEFSER